VYKEDTIKWNTDTAMKDSDSESDYDDDIATDLTNDVEKYKNATY